jgi:hypothetical protein
MLVGNRLSFLCKSTPPTFTSKYQRTCGGGDSFLIFNFSLKIKFINLAAAGFAIDRLEGDGIKIKSACTPLWEALAVFWHGCNTKK